MPEVVQTLRAQTRQVALPRYVPDTNVCLDLFVFASERCQSLRAAFEAGEIELVTREDCREEWLRVLRYAHLDLTDTARTSAETMFDRWVTFLPDTTAANASLPRCSDADDQKFLELALACSAHALLTRDKQLLKLARRTKRAGLFAILTPTAWADALAPA